MEHEREFLTTADAARVLAVTPVRIRQMEAFGTLPAIRTLGGQRLFRRQEVEALKRRRDAARASQDDGPPEAAA